jgi:hypothetical protein
MGIRHIAGPKEWGAYQQALLVSELKDDEGLEFSEIGEMLGISSVEAARRYRAIGALKFMESDDLFSGKAEPTFYRLFHELISLPEVRSRFGWSAEKNTFTDTDKAREFFVLICGDGKHDAKLKTFGDVRKLKYIVGRPKAEEALFDAEESFSEAIRLGEQGAEREDASVLLKDAKDDLARIGFAQVPKLTAEDLRIIDEMIALLTSMKKAVPSKAK